VADTVEERRQVTVLFSDASGYTGLAEDLDPEHVRELMAEVYACAEEIVARYGGRVDKSLLDGLEPPDELADAVIDRTQGNPFFVEEVVNRVRLGPRCGSARLDPPVITQVPISGAPADTGEASVRAQNGGSVHGTAGQSLVMSSIWIMTTVPPLRLPFACIDPRGTTPASPDLSSTVSPSTVNHASPETTRNNWSNPASCIPISPSGSKWSTYAWDCPEPDPR
jgi:hypothetical protein